MQCTKKIWVVSKTKHSKTMKETRSTQNSQLVQKINEPTEATKALKGHLSFFFSKSDLVFWFFQSKLIFVNIRFFFNLPIIFSMKKKKKKYIYIYMRISGNTKKITVVTCFSAFI